MDHNLEKDNIYLQLIQTYNDEMRYFFDEQSLCMVNHIDRES